MSTAMRRSRRIMVGHCRPAPMNETTAAALRATGRIQGIEIDTLDAWTLGPCRILRQHTPSLGWHLSISHPKRYPTWDELAEARYQLLPDDVTMVVVLPPSDQYVNAHPNCFHLHEAVNPDDGRIVLPAGAS